MDEDLQRLETVLGGYPDGRALPDVEQILAEAGVDASLLDRDERARKLLDDALTTRPLGNLDDVRQVAREVELLVLEVRHLTSALEAGLPNDQLPDVDERLAWARRRLQALQDLL